MKEKLFLGMSQFWVYNNNKGKHTLVFCKTKLKETQVRPLFVLFTFVYQILQTRPLSTRALKTQGEDENTDTFRKK